LLCILLVKTYIIAEAETVFESVY